MKFIITENSDGEKHLHCEAGEIFSKDELVEKTEIFHSKQEATTSILSEKRYPIKMDDC